MKRIILILLIFTHLFSAVGFSMNIHQCGSHKSYSLFGLEVGGICGCDHQNHKHSKDCCKDKKVEVKAQKKENIGSKILLLKHFPTVDFVPSINYTSKIILPVTTNTVTCFTGHPPNHSPPLYILHSVFRI